MLVGLPALRLHGIYLMIATISFGAIIQEIFGRWEAVTHGNEGMKVDKAEIFGFAFRSERAFYYLCLCFLVLALWLTRNLLRSPTGRALVAIRDSETAAKTMGVDMPIYKSIAFGIGRRSPGSPAACSRTSSRSSAPDMFTLLLSIEFMLVVIVGGLVQPARRDLRRDLHRHARRRSSPSCAIDSGDHRRAVARGTGLAPLGMLGNAVGEFLRKPGVEAGIFGLILGFILFEPPGMYGRWLKIKLFFPTFPMYKAATFKRQKSYMRSERIR